MIYSTSIYNMYLDNTAKRDDDYRAKSLLLEQITSFKRNVCHVFYIIKLLYIRQMLAKCWLFYQNYFEWLLLYTISLIYLMTPQFIFMLLLVCLFWESSIYVCIYINEILMYVCTIVYSWIRYNFRYFVLSATVTFQYYSNQTL